MSTLPGHIRYDNVRFKERALPGHPAIEHRAIVIAIATQNVHLSEHPRPERLEGDLRHHLRQMIYGKVRADAQAAREGTKEFLRKVFTDGLHSADHWKLLDDLLSPLLNAGHEMTDGPETADAGLPPA